MRCREARALLSLSLDDELRDADESRLAHHLHGCDRCRAERNRYETLRARLRVSEPMTVDLVPALRERLAGRPAPAVMPPDTGAAAAKRPGRSFAVAAAAALVVVVGVALLVPRSSRVDVTTAVPSGAPELHAPGNAALLLAWTTGGLPARALERTQSLVGVLAVTEVRGAELNLTAERAADGRERLSLPKGAAIPIDALAIDPAGYARNLPAAAARVVRALPRDGALLGATSARLRGIGPGGTLTFGPTTVRVTGVVADSLVGAAEVVVRDDGPLAIPTPRFLLVAYHGDRSELESAIASALKAHVRFRAPGETPYLRQGDAVLPQSLVKARFGEFWYRVDAHGAVTIDPAWVARNIVTIDVPGIGALKVHRLVAAALQRILAGTASAAHPTPAVGFAPQLISPSLGLSRHTWGIGLSLESAPDQRSRTIARLATAGFVWGGLWLNPSPDYYEWVGAAAP